ncbi:MAG: sugar ABC transporter permease, partial [Microcystaceae cyanobacterium]
MNTRYSAQKFWGIATPYLFLLPALVILAIAVFYPAFQAFSLSFTQYDLDLTQAPQ